MKQILTYISPDKEFNKEHAMAVKIQIDNSLRLGWSREDIMLVTNFNYEYNGLRALVIGDDNYCKHTFPATKVYVIDYLFKAGRIEDELYWYHDFDSFELNKIIESEVLAEMGDCDLGASNYCQRPRLCSASMFFNNRAGDMFSWIKKEVDAEEINEETSLMRMVYDQDNQMNKRFKMVNTTYAFHKFNIIPTYKTTIKPIRVAHFHLTPDKYEFYVKGENKLDMVLIPRELINIMNKNGFNG